MGRNPDAWVLLTNHRGLQVHVYRPRNVAPSAPSMKESVERVVTRVGLRGVIQGHAIGTDVVLQAKELPACIPRLDPRLSHVDGDDLSLPRNQFNMDTSKYFPVEMSRVYIFKIRN